MTDAQAAPPPPQPASAPTTGTPPPPPPPQPVAAKARQPKGCLAVIVVGLVMVGILVGGAFASDALANLPPKPVSVGPVSVVVPNTWTFEGRGEDGNAILLSRGNGSLGVAVLEGTDATATLEEMRAEWESTGTVTTSDIQPVPDLRPGETVQRFAYTGEFEGLAGPVEGEVTAVAGDGFVVVFDGWSGIGDYVTVRDEIETMIGGATIP
jgi:hypothetical protein